MRTIAELIERVKFIDNYQTPITTMASKVWQDDALWWMQEWRELAVQRLTEYGYGP